MTIISNIPAIDVDLAMLGVCPQINVILRKCVGYWPAYEPLGFIENGCMYFFCINTINQILNN